MKNQLRYEQIGKNREIENQQNKEAKITFLAPTGKEIMVAFPH